MPVDRRSVTVNRALDFLFPRNGRQALDVKFFMEEESTVEILAEQICACFSTLHDPAYAITDVDAA
ncbi:hypothetical protein AA14337_2888 [Acetobacter malorum DSM 14337]|uniref:Uncharacterized protein n=1 Tax=Acetobacter malorum DSM 14337 TaxID=1307910 RepID=A0ABQ0PYC9_9PROT|nr:hypothetical protein AD930_06830 [Acetobacter malorum]GBQ84686.1 hypothetical protein AA14337_2888 [Acetobacter malorum DSM 14337]